MRRRAVAMLLLVTACSAKTPIVTDTGTPSATASVSVTPAPRVPIARQAVYALGDSIWLYDVASNTVREVARGAGVRAPRWVSPTQVSFIQGERGGASVLRL